MGLHTLGKTNVNTPGLSRSLYIANVDDFVLGSEPKADTGIAVTTAPTFKTGKSWSKVDITADSGKLDIKVTTKGDSKSYENTYEFFIGGTSETQLAWVDLVGAGDYIALIVDKCGGDTYVVGCPCSPVKMMSADGTTGQKSGDERGFKIVMKSADQPLIWKLTTIDLLPA